MISLASIALTLTVGLVLMQYAHGIVNGQSTMWGTSAYRESNVILRYCYEHADRPNPVQDLIDKGLMSSNMTGIICKDVKQISDINQNQISDLANKLNQVGIK